MAGYRPRSAAERRFLESYDPGRFERPSVTADTVLLRRGAGRSLEALLIRRGGHPYRGFWALPGGFLDVDADTDLETAATRELEEETGLAPPARIVPFGCFGRKGRDPRGRTVTVAFLCLAGGVEKVEGRDDATEAGWFRVVLDLRGRAAASRHGRSVRLAFDHAEVIGAALSELRRRAAAAQPFLELLDPTSTASEATLLAEIVAG
jgi:8-oxo-dGTP diphosphatase